MLNKKSIFNFIYAIALISLVTTCIGLLNELIEFIQRYSVRIWDLGIGNNTKISNWVVIFLFYLIIFLISTFITAIKILKFANIIKWKYVNIIGIIGCSLSLILSFVMLYLIEIPGFGVVNGGYLMYNSLHTAAFAFFAYFGITFVCDLINKRYSDKNDSEQNS